MVRSELSDQGPSPLKTSWPSGNVVPGHAAAQTESITVLRTGARFDGRAHRAGCRRENFPGPRIRTRTNPRYPAKNAVLFSRSEQDDRASGSRLVSPRAAAHVWGKRARILTEINRLTQPALSTPAKTRVNSVLWRTVSIQNSRPGTSAYPFLAL